jgi:hypothetical protein
VFSRFKETTVATHTISRVAHVHRAIPTEEPTRCNLPGKKLKFSWFIGLPNRSNGSLDFKVCEMERLQLFLQATLLFFISHTRQITNLRRVVEEGSFLLIHCPPPLSRIEG